MRVCTKAYVSFPGAASHVLLPHRFYVKSPLIWEEAKMDRASESERGLEAEANLNRINDEGDERKTKKDLHLWRLCFTCT